MDVTLLGAPSIGVDSTTNDRNKIVDDFMQCTLGQWRTPAPHATDPDGIMANCTQMADDMPHDEERHLPESRSKLVVRAAMMLTISV